MGTIKRLHVLIKADEDYYKEVLFASEELPIEDEIGKKKLKTILTRSANLNTLDERVTKEDIQDLLEGVMEGDGVKEFLGNEYYWEEVSCLSNN